MAGVEGGITGKEGGYGHWIRVRNKSKERQKAGTERGRSGVSRSRWDGLGWMELLISCTRATVFLVPWRLSLSVISLMRFLILLRETCVTLFPCFLCFCLVRRIFMLSKSTENKLERGFFYFSFARADTFQCPWRWLCPHLWTIREVLSPSPGVQETRWDAHWTFFVHFKVSNHFSRPCLLGGVGKTNSFFQSLALVCSSQETLAFSASPKCFEGKGGVIKFPYVLKHPTELTVLHTF